VCGGGGAGYFVFAWLGFFGAGWLGYFGDAEVAADFGDQFGDGAGFKVVVELLGVEAFLELVVEAFRVGFFGGSLDGVFDGADDALAAMGAVFCRLGRFGRLADALGEVDCAADAAGDPFESEGEDGRGLGGVTA